MKSLIIGKGVRRNGIFECFLGGGTHLCTGTDIDGEDQDDAGANHGALGSDGSSAQCVRMV